ncbi:hypothetical protein MCU23_15450 [Klebsiella quasipneumoniae]|uniref:hypothetical protein n=1 Tax=Klebsiella quasipneumoniae TaxID=1463165 RepID=UPI002247F91A|nr:hypothetical protein [Klebsiella quasipneumoniae]MCX2316752.1 hypothetical protein [Klebsiella quasipneumoniae]
MKSNTLRKRPTDVPVQKVSVQPGKDLREADKQRQHKEFIAAMNEFIAAMNEFIAKGGTLTDDDFFRVL